MIKNHFVYPKIAVLVTRCLLYKNSFTVITLKLNLLRNFQAVVFPHEHSVIWQGFFYYYLQSFLMMMVFSCCHVRMYYYVLFLWSFSFSFLTAILSGLRNCFFFLFPSCSKFFLSGVFLYFWISYLIYEFLYDAIIMMQ